MAAAVVHDPEDARGGPVGLPCHELYDNAHVALRLSNGAQGRLWASMVAAGQEHGLHIRVFGEAASLDWRQEDPHHLVLRSLDGSARIFAQGGAGLCTQVQRFTHVGLGHPEGFLESFANLYGAVADDLQRRRKDTFDAASASSYPTIPDGVIGMRFVDAVKASHATNGRWTDATIDV